MTGPADGNWRDGSFPEKLSEREHKYRIHRRKVTALLSQEGSVIAAAITRGVVPKSKKFGLGTTPALPATTTSSLLLGRHGSRGGTRRKHANHCCTILLASFFGLVVGDWFFFAQA